MVTHFFFLIDKLFNPIKRPHSGLPSSASHESPWELMTAFSWHPKCQRKIFFSSIADGETSTATHSHSLVGNWPSTTGPRWISNQVLRPQFLWKGLLHCPSSLSRCLILLLYSHIIHPCQEISYTQQNFTIAAERFDCLPMTREYSIPRPFKAGTKSCLFQSTGGSGPLATLGPYVRSRRVPIWYQLDP